MSMIKAVVVSFSSLCVLCASAVQAEKTHPDYQKRWLTGIFFSEGATFGDFNKDGKVDAVSGPYIYDGPEFTMKRAYMPVAPQEPLAYSTNFLAFAHDFDRDGWQDVFIVGFPGAEGFWYRNPEGKSEKGEAGHWKRHLVHDNIDNESPTFGNLVGDDQPELICMSGGYLGYATPDQSDPTKPWTFHRVSPKVGYQRFTHGLGFGDVNGDGRTDLIEKSGWWEQPEKLDGDPEWKKHEFEFAPGAGGSQMYAYDVDGDKDNDVITALAGHGYGLAWYEHVKDGSQITFKQHLILSPKAEEKMNGVQFSQLHAVDLVDMDGDGLKDILTGKRYWGHGPTGDPEPNAPPVLYYFKLTRDNGKAKFEPIRIDDNSGVGTQIVARDADGDKKPDVVVGNKKGTMLFLTAGKDKKAGR